MLDQCRNPLSSHIHLWGIQYIKIHLLVLNICSHRQTNRQMFILGQVYPVFCLRNRKTVFTFKEKWELDVINIFCKMFSTLKWSPARGKHEEPGTFTRENAGFGFCQEGGNEELSSCPSPSSSDDTSYTLYTSSDHLSKEVL